MLGKLPVLGRPTKLDNSRARAYCAYSRCGRGVVRTFFLSHLSLTSLFSLPLSGRRPDMKYRLKGPLKPKLPTTQKGIAVLTTPRTNDTLVYLFNFWS